MILREGMTEFGRGFAHLLRSSRCAFSGALRGARRPSDLPTNGAQAYLILFETARRPIDSQREEIVRAGESSTTKRGSCTSNTTDGLGLRGAVVADAEATEVERANA